MSNLKTLLLATAMGVATITTGAQAATYVTTSQEVVAPAQTVTYVAPQRIVGGRIITGPIDGPTVAAKSMVAVGTRKVGMVGGRPYPIENAHVENTRVKATPVGLVESTTVTHTGGPIKINSGGDYYTDTDGNFYADPAWDVRVHSSGGYND